MHCFPINCDSPPLSFWENAEIELYRYEKELKRVSQNVSYENCAAEVLTQGSGVINAFSTDSTTLLTRK